MSVLVSNSDYRYLAIPAIINKLKPPAADKVSVHPTCGSLSADVMIEGLTMHTGSSFGFIFFSVFSAIALVRVYVLGKPPRILSMLSFYY
jgi:hypothetical protein